MSGYTGARPQGYERRQTPLEEWIEYYKTANGLQTGSGEALG